MVSIWDVHTEVDSEQPRRIDAHNANIESLSFSPDDALFATTSPDNSVKLWSLDTLENVQVFRQDGLHGGGFFRGRSTCRDWQL